MRFDENNPIHIRWLFDYDAHTGDLIWKRSNSMRAPAGSVAGSDDGKGYRKITINGRGYKSHRLIWVYWMGAIPNGLEIDHISRERSNNRIFNLRLASRSQNSANRKVRSENKVGLKGVSQNGKRFQARIKINGKMVSLGTFDTPTEAHIEYLRASKSAHGEFSIK